MMSEFRAPQQAREHDEQHQSPDTSIQEGSRSDVHREVGTIACGVACPYYRNENDIKQCHTSESKEPIMAHVKTDLAERSASGGDSKKENIQVAGRKRFIGITVPQRRFGLFSGLLRKKEVDTAKLTDSELIEYVARTLDHEFCVPQAHYAAWRTIEGPTGMSVAYRPKKKKKTSPKA